MEQQDNQNTAFSAPRLSANFSHAYLIWGGSEADRTISAENLAAGIICEGAGRRPCKACVHCEKAARHIHPDIMVIDRNPDTRTIYVDQVRNLREDAVIMPNEARKKVYIINNAGAMNPSAQNAILKVLEEPPASATFILVAENPAELLPTVRSRCIERSVENQAAAGLPETNETAAAFYKALTGGPLKLTEFSFALEKLEKNDFADFIDGAKALLAQKLKASLGGTDAGLSSGALIDAVSVLDEAKEYFYNNVGLGHISGMICARLIMVGGAPKPPRSR